MRMRRELRRLSGRRRRGDVIARDGDTAEAGLPIEVGLLAEQYRQEVRRLADEHGGHLPAWLRYVDADEDGDPSWR